MSKNFVLLSLLATVLMTFASCSGDDDANGNSGFNPENEKMVGTKWTFTNQDYGIGDDYVSTLEQTYIIYFYSNTEGLTYSGRKDFDTDLGSSSKRSVAYFNYNVVGNEIDIDYITDPNLDISKLKLNGDVISANGIDYEKGIIDSSDNTWLATLHGTTGDCKWYYDLMRTLWIIGEGDMADYSSYETTPWGKNDRTPNNVIVDTGVTSIGAYAFANPSIGEVDMPYSSLTKISPYAFAGASISEIYLSDNITVIGDGAFAGCSYLKKVYLPENVETIGDFAFEDCKEASLYDTKKLKKVGQYAFLGCEVTTFTNSEVLEEVGTGAFSNLAVSKLILPNSLETLGHIAFDGNIGEIHVGTGLKNVTGTPFYPNKTGKIYVNLGVPLKLETNFLDPASGWTLYVPEGSKTAYSQASYWKNFKSIVEDETLESGNGTPDGGEDGDDNGDGGNVDIIMPETYSNGGNVYEWVKVESPTLPTFYIMQTELDPDSHFRINDNVDIGILNLSGDCTITKYELRVFLEKTKEVTGIQLRLPTREEWMYAARGGNKSNGYTYSGSNDIDEVAWYKGNSDNCAHYPAHKKPNELGLYDMCGNYGELCNNDADNLPNVDGMICGGCWNDAASDCKITSYEEGEVMGLIPGTSIKEKNAFDARKIAVRLVFTAPN